MEALSLHTGAAAENWDDNTSFISVVEDKRVAHRFKHIIDIPVYLIQEQFDNGLFLLKYENFSFMPADMCTKPCSGLIISRSTEWMTGFRFYSSSET